MKITYIGHSGFLVEAEDCLFLFDYYQAERENGFPTLPETKRLYVFVSHFHSDHFNPEIFTILHSHLDIRYILSADIKPKQIPAEQLSKVTFVQANQTYLFEEITVTTLKSTDSGVAFLLHHHNSKEYIYHAGDLNWWVWENDTRQEANDMKARFTCEIDKLKGLSVSVAFLPLDPRQGSLFWKGFDYTMRTVNFQKGFPMHMWHDFTVIHRLKQLETSVPYRSKIINLCEGENTYEF